MPRPSCLGIEPPERADVLSRVPDAAVARGGDVVRMASRRDGVLAHREARRGSRRGGTDDPEGERDCQARKADVSQGLRDLRAWRLPSGAVRYHHGSSTRSLNA